MAFNHGSHEISIFMEGWACAAGTAQSQRHSAARREPPELWYFDQETPNNCYVSLVWLDDTKLMSAGRSI
jgi:hypothetical protein